MAVKKAKKKIDKKINIPAVVIIGVVVIALIISGVVLLCNKGGSSTQQSYIFNKERASGIDVSEFNGTVNWDKLSASQDFAIVRAGYTGYETGEMLEDNMLLENLDGAVNASIPVGVYYYSQAVNEQEAVKEADFVYDKIKDYELKLPVFMDMEIPYDFNGNPVGRLSEANNSPEENAKIINAFCERLEKKGYTAGVYASSSFLKFNISQKKLNDSIVVWVADYGDSVSYDVDYDIWQYTKRGECDGVISKFADLNYWYQGDNK